MLAHRQGGLIFTVCIIGVLFQSYLLAQTSLEKQFVAEYPGASEKLEAFYQRVCVSQERLSYHGTTGNRTVIDYLANGPCTRIDLKTSEQEQLTWILDPERCCVINKKEGQYSLVKIASPNAASDTLRMKAKLPFAVYSVLDQRIKDFMAHKAFRVTTVAHVDTQSGRMLKVNWESPFVTNNGQKQTRFGWFIFDPSHSWALQEYAFAFDKTATRMRRAVITYDGYADNIPIVRRADYFYESNDGTREPDETVEVTNIELSPAPSEAFKLSAFGISDEVGRPPLRSSIGWVSLLMSGLLMLMVAYAIRRWSHHYTPTSQ